MATLSLYTVPSCSADHTGTLTASARGQRPLRLIVYDEQGVAIKELFSNTFSSHFVIKFLPNGLYTLNLSDASGEEVENNVEIECTPPVACDLLLGAPTYTADTAGGFTALVPFTTTAGDLKAFAFSGVRPTTGIVYGLSPLVVNGLVAEEVRSVTIEDRNGCQQTLALVTPAEEPDPAPAPPARRPHFLVPLPNSLRFYQASAGLLDNTAFAEQRPLNYTNPGYCQLVNTADTLVLQLQSNYANAPVCQLLRCSDSAQVATLAPVRVVQGSAQTLSFAAYLRPDTAAGKVRVYFNSDSLPLPFEIGNEVIIAGAGSLNGTKQVQSVLEDPASAAPYLLLSGVYPTGAQRIDCLLSMDYAAQSFDTWQVVVPFSSVAPGCYYLRLSATDADFLTAEALSDSIDVRYQHQDTVLVAYRNFDNAFGLNYTAGIINRLRVKGRLVPLAPTSEKDVLRQSNDTLELLSARVRRQLRLDTFLLPAWLHEKLVLALNHDFKTLNGQRVSLTEDYATTAVDRYLLSNGSVTVEPYEGLGAGNADDLGDVDSGEGEFLLADNNFLRINR
ncbi:hypothetical protein [Hymenobacter guriensis]|uniref:T9SS type A sorting domain-containing protein n=1 Tax=Hymenobacter guriensis TaxID=2793065 RepID=A0ABS0KZ14_9BACT|nr:hypothetical protein [Hymenobacter guriensis]MBG8553081.1 hypothetical protein [Hymenobacter guriensis]